MSMVIVPNQKIVAHNAEHGTDLPPLSVSVPGSTYEAHEVEIRGQDGAVAAVVRYDPEMPLLCGCHVSIEVYGSMTASWRDIPDGLDMNGVPCKPCEEARKIREATA